MPQFICDRTFGNLLNIEYIYHLWQSLNDIPNYIESPQ
jgi:hypothetical protein